ncbi:50S ribosomal protein L20 [bacterium]|nr:50S ribosomal protein L20 [bacterium]
MPRTTATVASRQRRKKILSATKGYRQGGRRLIRQAQETLVRAYKFAYRDRKVRKREMRKLWILRINAAAREHGLNYSRLLSGLERAGVAIDRKMLADMAVRQPEAFASLVETARAA